MWQHGTITHARRVWQVAWVEIKRLMKSVKPQRKQQKWHDKPWRASLKAMLGMSSWAELCAAASGSRLTGDLRADTGEVSAAAARQTQSTETTVFDQVMIVIIMVNGILLALIWPNQSQQWMKVLGYLDVVFVVIYIIEALLKYLTVGRTAYLRGNWNRFDLFIVFVSILDLTPIPEQVDIVDPSFFQVLRLLRLVKVSHATAAAQCSSSHQ